jgi:hypothetical protein
LSSLLIRVVQNYRYWVLWRCPHVRFLDYKKVKDVERQKAAELFGTAAEPTALASKVWFLLLGKNWKLIGRRSWE